jgi:hypothetical protein
MVSSNSGHNFGTICERSISTLEVQQHPELKARYRDGLAYIQSMPSTRREPSNLLARSVVTFMPVSIEHSEDHIVAALLPRPLFGAVDDAYGRRTLRIVSDHHLGGGEIEMRAGGLKIRLFGLSFANN